MESMANTAQANAAALLNVSEIALRLQVKESWVYTHADQLGAYRLGKYLRFDWQRVRQRLEQSATVPHQSHN